MHRTRFWGEHCWKAFFLWTEDVLYLTSQKKEMDFYQVKAKHLDGIVSQLKLTKDIDVAIFMYELEHGTFKVSLRSSEKIDVSVVASYFGGGGHARAADSHVCHTA